MMTIGLRLRQGSRYLNLNSGRYGVTPSFVPPETKYTAQVTRGTALNTRGGSLVSKRAENREWKVALNVLVDDHASVDAAAADVQRWLNEAGDTREPLFIEWRMDDSVPEPVWGQFNAWRSYEIVHGGVTLVQSGEFNYAQLARIGLTLEIKPYALGNKQRLTAVAGGIAEDDRGAGSGQARGLIVPEATTNKMTNPVFGNSTWNTGWTVGGADVIIAKNSLAEFVLFGQASAKATFVRSGLNAVYQSINVGNTNTHTLSGYFKKPDGSAVTAADVRLRYGATIGADAYTAVGDGWYRATLQVTGIASAQVAGLQMYGGTVYVGAMQLEEKAYATPIAYGELLGCAWTGTAHASTSTRTAGVCKLVVEDGTLDMAQGTLRAIWRMPVASTHPNTLYVFACGAALLRAYFNPADDKFYLTDNTNTISSAAQTWAAGDVLVLDFAWGQSGLAIYKNGVSIASGATYTPAALTSIYLGTDASGANNTLATMVVETFDLMLTATQVAANYALLLPLLANGQRPATVPWLWTKDGDDTLDNCLDTSGSTGAPHTNYGVVGGVPGSAPAATVFRFEKIAGTQIGEVWISHVPTDEFLNPADWLYMELGGTANAPSSGGAYQDTAALSTTAVEIAAKNLTERYYRELAKRSFYLFGLFPNDGVGTANLQIGGLLTGMTTPDYQTYQKNIGASVGVTKSMKLADALSQADGQTITVSLYAKRSTGSATLSTDFVMIMPEPVVRISNTASPSDLVLDSERGAFFGYAYQVPCVRQTPIELQPDRINLLMALIQNNTTGWVITHTLQANSIEVTPRWELL